MLPRRLTEPPLVKEPWICGFTVHLLVNPCLSERVRYNTPMSFFWQAILVEGGLAVIALAVGLGIGINYQEYCQFDGGTLCSITWGLLPLVAGYFVLQALPIAGLQRIDRLVRELFQQHMGHLALWQLALIAALAGIGEELFFRGMLQQGLAFFVDVWLAVLISSLIFGLAHAATPTYFFLAFIISLYLGFLFVHTDNLLVPIAVHALYDFAVFLYIRFTPGKN